MAKFSQSVENLIKDFDRYEQNAEKMMGEMTQEGAKVVKKNILNNLPSSLKNSNIKNCLKITKTYKTPSDLGINTKVAFYGYFKNKRGKKVPAPLIANVFEHGTSTVSKQPFIRKSFKNDEIENAMNKVVKRYFGKD